MLDVGCGGGILTESMGREGAKVTGLDIDAEQLTMAYMGVFKSGGALDDRQETVWAHANSHPGPYDVVTCMEMLEHVPDLASIVRACARLVNAGGEVLFSMLNRNPKAWLLAIV